jgi:ADP-ribose pyrophosphatase YjhB (NUDIX family)
MPSAHERSGSDSPAALSGPVVGVGAVVFRDGRALMVRRGKEPSRGRWLVPGGTVLLGERLEEAVVRETREETGVAVAPREVLTVVDRIDREGDDVRYHFVIVDFLCDDLGGEPRADSDAEAVAWLGREDFEAYDVPKQMQSVLLKGQGRAAALAGGSGREGRGDS